MGKTLAPACAHNAEAGRRARSFHGTPEHGNESGKKIFLCNGLVVILLLQKDLEKMRQNGVRQFYFYALGVIAALFLTSGCSTTEYKTDRTGPKLKQPRPVDRPSPKDKKNQPPPYYVRGKWYQPLAHARDFKQVGIASWYGKDFHGKPTSSGEIYDMYKVSAAHKILPLGTWVRVVNLENTKSLDVRINDRGPFVNGRVIDLSYAAAKKIGIVGPGTADVRVIALGKREKRDTKYGNINHYTPVNFYKGKFSIQVGAFSKRENAERLRRMLDAKYKNVHVSSYFSHKDGKTLHRVLVAKVSSLDKAEKYRKILKGRGHKTAFVVAE